MNHTNVSMIKSGVRIAGCILGWTGNIALFAILLLVAELLGIVEELV